MQKLFDQTGQKPWWTLMGGTDQPEYPGVDPVFTTPLTPRGGVPTQQLGGAGGLRTQPGSVTPGGAGSISLNQGLAQVYAPGQARQTLTMDPRRLALLAQLYQRRRFGTTPPVGPQAPQGPAGYGGAS